MIILEDGQMAVIKAGQVELQDFEGRPVEKNIKHISWSRIAAEKEGHKHFMLKEIHEQPRAVADSLRGRISEEKSEVVFPELGKLNLKEVDKIVICACGTSYHSGMVAKYWIEEHVRIPVDVELASEFRYRNPIINDKTLWLGISQSGETADTLAALYEAKSKNAKLLSCLLYTSDAADE